MGLHRGGCHLMTVGTRGTSMKAEDRFAIPLRWGKHLDLHKYGSKRHNDVFRESGVDAERLADGLWEIFTSVPEALRLARRRRAVMEHVV